MAKYQKGIHPQTKRILVFRDCYGSSFAYMKELVDELRKDFPDARDEDIEFKEFDNSYRKHILCLCYNPTSRTDIMDEYEEFPIDWVALRH